MILGLIALVVAVVAVVVAVLTNASEYDSKEDEAYEEWRKHHGE